jgi:hypothetical protein
VIRIGAPGGVAVAGQAVGVATTSGVSVDS